MKKIIVMTGAGISAESGISTFRDVGGLWEGHDIMEVASPQGWHRNPNLVLDFYNKRRRQLLEVQPNPAHFAIQQLERKYHVSVITQNVDDLHERAGSSQVVHLHGELRKARSVKNESLVYQWDKDLNLGDFCEEGGQLRPHIVWFGEEVPLLETAAILTQLADIVLIIGTSLQVYPAASLVSFAQKNIPIYYIDPNPQINFELSVVKGLKVLDKKASIGVVELVDSLLSEA